MRKEGGNGLGPFWGALILATVCVFFFFVYARQSAKRFVFRPHPVSYQKDASFFELEAKDGSLLTVFWEGEASADWTVFYCCGSDEDIGRAMARLQTYRLKGYNVACFDYRGFGHTPGEATERNVYDDAETVYDFIRSQKKIPESKIVIHGRSLGGGVALELATRRSPGGIILESTFRSVYRSILTLNWIPGDLFENERKVADCRCRALLIHGSSDRVIPIEHAEVLKAAFGPGRARLFSVEGAGHDNLMEVADTAYWSSIESFLRSLKQG